MVLSPILVQASFLSGPPEDKLPLAYMPLGLRVAQRQVFAGEWMKPGHVGGVEEEGMSSGLGIRTCTHHLQAYV